MKRNGFTLVELLAGLVILGVIMTIATISYGSYINSSKQKSYKDAEKSMRASAESFLTYCSTTFPMPGYCNMIPEGEEEVVIYLEDDLVDHGFMDRVVDHGNGGTCSGQVIVKNTGNGGENNIELSYRVCLQCSDYKSRECN